MKIKFYLAGFIFSFLFLSFLLPSTIYAQLCNVTTGSPCTWVQRIFEPDCIGIDTAIGCVPALGSENQLFGFILKWAIGVGSGLAFLLIIYAGFMIMTSAGNPERLQAGKELLTAAIMGLILLIFSVFILRVIGVDILVIPGFGK